MSAPFIVLAIIAVIAIIGLFLLMWGVGIYNSLVALRNRFKNAYSQIDVQLKRRYDLIPNLVEVAKGYLKHEHDTLEAVMAARSGAVSSQARVAADPTDPAAMKQLVAAEGSLTGSLGRLFAVAEAYPDLKANATMAQLSEELTSTENKVSFARQAYNDAVMTYNTSREVFPNSIFAGMFNFAPRQCPSRSRMPRRSRRPRSPSAQTPSQARAAQAPSPGHDPPHHHGLLRPRGGRPARQPAPGRAVRARGGGHRGGDERRRRLRLRPLPFLPRERRFPAAVRTPGVRSVPATRPAGRVPLRRPCGDLPVHGRDHRPQQPVAHVPAQGRRRGGGHHARRAGARPRARRCQGAHPGQRGRGDGDRLGGADAAGVRARPRGERQRLRRRQRCRQRGDHGDARHPRTAQPG